MMGSGVDKEIEDYRTLLQSAVDMGLLTEAEADDAADAIRCVAKLHKRGVITMVQADHLLNKLAKQAAAHFREWARDAAH